jgi:uncharacterized protein DUF3300
MKHLRHRTAVALLPLLLAMSASGHAQAQAPTRAEAEGALNPAPAPLTKAQLDQMLAPIALYPDQLLTELLMAATFPQQVVDAGKWLQDSNNAALKGDDLVNALQPLPWDPSVKSLIAFPQIIAMMNDHLDWTEALGTAFAGQEVETMSRVQFLRERAMHAGQLQSSTQLAVREEASDIIIEPANPDTVYVPIYNPAVVYGEWPDADAPPVYLPPPPGFYNGEVGAGIAFSVGLAVVAPLWGWGHPDWRHHDVAVDPQRFDRITATTSTTDNHITIQNNTWHRTAPVVVVAPASRPQQPAATGRQPPGTVTSAAIKAPAAANPPPSHAGPPAVEHPPEPPAHGGETAHPAAAPNLAPVPPGETHPTEARPQTPPGETHPTEARPQTPPGETHPTEARPQAPSAEAPQHAPAAAPQEHPAEPPHPGPPAPPPHPPAAPPQEHAEPPHPAPPPPPHPPAAAPPHPAPPAPPPHPAAPPPKKPPPKPGEEEKPEPPH